MTRSIQRHLTKTIVVAMIVAALAAAAASFGFVYVEAREFQDDLLKQVAGIVARRGPPQAPGKTAGSIGADPDGRLSIWRMPGDAPPVWWKQSLKEGWHTVASAGEELRVYVDEGDDAVLTVVAQPTEARDEIATHSAVRAFLPFFLLVLLVPLLVLRIVRRELAPVNQMADWLDAQPVDRLGPIANSHTPDEIAPFVAAINRLIERANAMLQQQRRFVADAAHELRSPLTALMLQAQNLRKADSLDAVRQRVEPLQEGIERARRLTEQLLNLARAQSGEAAAVMVDLRALARDLVAEYLPAAELRQIDLGFAQAVPLAVAANPELLRQVLRNGLENALKYAPNGGEVSIRITRQGADAVFEIIDDGPGVPESERERVFDSFYRGRGAEGQGSGLGLAIARESAAKLGGSISLGEREGAAGLVFIYRQKIEPAKNAGTITQGK